MNKFKINDTVEHSEGFGVVHEVSENGLKYLVDDNTDFGWFQENELTLVDSSIEFQFESPELFNMWFNLIIKPWKKALLIRAFLVYKGN